MADDRDPAFRPAAGPVIRLRERPAERGGGAERLVEPARGREHFRRLQFPVPRDVLALDAPGSDALEDVAAARPHRCEDRVGERRVAEVHEAFRRGHREVPEHQAVDRGEHRCGCPDAQRHDQHQRGHECRRPAERPQRVGHVLPGAFDPRGDPCGSRVLAGERDVAHGSVAGAGGVLRRGPGAPLALLRHQTVGLDLLGDLRLDLPLPEHVPEPSEYRHDGIERLIRAAGP
jgi:hypothetical protein